MLPKLSILVLQFIISILPLGHPQMKFTTKTELINIFKTRRQITKFSEGLLKSILTSQSQFKHAQNLSHLR